MASTYSNNLRLELIGTGDQAGTWGNTTNTNIGTLIEKAVSGSESVTVSAANTALTALNGADDQSRNMMLVLDTSTGANFAVYAPPSPKIYVVRNASSYTATIYNSTIAGNTTAAGTGVAVSTGNTAFVYTDGTNFRTLSVDELSGTLPVTNGGTGQTTLTANNVILGNGTSAVQTVAPGTVGNVLVSDGTTWTSGVGVPSGSLFMWPTGTAPTGYLLCNGTAVDRTTYATLFGVIGTTFGAGNGSTTFNLPDYRDRMPIGAGTTYSAASSGGNKDAIVVSHSHSASTASAGSHEHYLTHNTLVSASGQAIVDVTSGNYIAARTTGGTDYAYVFRATGNAANIGRSSAAGSHSHTVTVNSTGSSATNANLPPYLGIYFIIKT